MNYFLQKLKRHFLKLMVVSVTLMLTGCVYFVVGGMGVLGGYVVSPDTVEGVTEYDFITVWDSTVEVVGVMGRIVDQYEEAGMIEARVAGARVTITISQLSTSAVKLTVKSRRTGFPRIKTAQDVYVKIMSHVIGE